MKPTESKIKSIKENIFYRSRDSICDYKTFDWHVYRKNIDADKVNSSQALAIDFWGCLKISSYKNQIINYIFNKEYETWEVIFEYEDKTLLNEKKSTQIDVVLKNESTAIFIESKFTETDGGKCSQLNKTKSGFYQCNGNYEEQTNPVNGINSYCALSGKGIKYWDYIDRLTSFNKTQKYQPCPIRMGEFQWIRNICLAEALSDTCNNTSETYLVYYKSIKCPISVKVEHDLFLGNLKGKIINPKSFMPLSYNELLERIIEFIDSQNLNEKQVWIDLKKWMETKESKL